MRKEELRKLRALPATREMMQKGKRYVERQEKRPWDNKVRTVIEPEYDVLLRVQNLSGYIKIAAFLPRKMRADVKTPIYEIFLNVKGEEYITRELDDNGDEVRWLSSMVCNLPGLDYYSWYSYQDKANVFVSQDGMKTLNSLQLEHEGSKPKGLQRLRRWQQEQKDKDTARREQREQAPWDADMKLIPKLPGSFEEWMRKEVAPEAFLIYEYDPKGQKNGYCSRCKKQVPIMKPKHGKKTKCPACKTKAVFVAHTRMQTLATSSYDGEIMQRFNGGIVVRSFEQRQWYRNSDYRKPHIRTHEFERIMIFDDGRIKRYSWENYKQKKHRWVQDKQYFPRNRSYYRSKSRLYKRNIPQLKKYSLLKQSAVDLWPKLPMSVTNYIEVEKANPAIEMLARLGMFRLAEDIIEARYDRNLLDEAATELSKMLKIDKNRLRRLKEMDANLYSLRWMQYEKEADTIWPDAMIRDFGEASFETSAFNFLHVPISFVKCHNYLKKQSAMMGETMAQTLITWRDYTNMADQMKMNTKCDQIAKPKDLKAAHAEMILLREAKELKKQASAIGAKGILKKVWYWLVIGIARYIETIPGFKGRIGCYTWDDKGNGFVHVDVRGINSRGIYTENNTNYDSVSTFTTSIRRGSKGRLVKVVQRRLRAAGLYWGLIDGKCGAGMEKGIVKWNAKYGRANDKSWGPKCWNEAFPA